MNKSLIFAVELCILSFVFLMFSMLVTEGRPVARAAINGIGILLMFLMFHFAPKPDSKRETNYQKFVFGLEIVILIFWFLIFITMIGMIQISLIESGYVSPDAFNSGPSP